MAVVVAENGNGHYSVILAIMSVTLAFMSVILAFMSVVLALCFCTVFNYSILVFCAKCSVHIITP